MQALTSLYESLGSSSNGSSEHIQVLIEQLRVFCATENAEAYLVGGVIRDVLLRRKTTDVDLVLIGGGSEILHRLASALKSRLITLDPSRNITRIMAKINENVFQVDVNSVQGEIEADLRQRDFSIDALAVPIYLFRTLFRDQSAEVLDPTNGLSDLKRKVIRCTSPTVFRDDPARLLRGPRLAAQLGFQIADCTSSYIRNQAHLIKSVAPERVRDEFIKILESPNSALSIRRLDDLGILCLLMPELSQSRDVSQPKEHQWDVFNHLIETSGQVERLIPSQGKQNFNPEYCGYVDPGIQFTPTFDLIEEYFAEEVSDGYSRIAMTKLAGLLHDIGKPATRTVEESGKIRFLGHHIVGADIAEDILRRLRISGRGVELVKGQVLHHLRPSQMAPAGSLPSGKAIYRYFRDVGGAAIDTLYLNMADYLAARGRMVTNTEWRQHCAVIDRILSQGLSGKAPEALPNLINGRDIMNSTRMAPGPKIGRLLQIVKEAQSEGNVSSKDEALELVTTHLLSEEDFA